MPNSGGLREISLARVDLESHPLRAPAAADLALLRDSLATVGLLAPPRVRPRGWGRWQVVTGWKRFQAASQLGWRKIPALTLAAETPASHDLLLYLHDNAFNRAFTSLERVLLASRLLRHWDRGTVVGKFLPLLGLPPSPVFLDRLLAAAALEDPWPELLAQDRLALTAAARLAAWDPVDRLAALPFLRDLPLSQSKQEEFLEDAELLSRREGSSPAGILLRWELQQPLIDQSRTPQERLAAVRRVLKQWVAPLLTHAQEAFTAGLERLGLKHHPRLRLKEPPAFEGPDFECTLKFTDARELQEILEELSRLARLPDFEKLARL